MARLEAAKKTGSGSQPIAAAEVASPPPLEKQAPKGPPPLKKRSQQSTPGANGGSFTSKPAHLLVAELEAQQREKREARKATLDTAEDEISKSEIAQVEMPKPEAKINRKKIPAWLLFVVLAVVASLCVGGGLYYAQREPPPPAPQVDPELIAKAEAQKAALAALNEGHELFGVGKDKDKVDQAIALYKKAVELAPDLAKAERALGIAYAAKSDEAEAVIHYKRFLELDPNAPEAAQVRTIIEKYEKNAADKNKKPK